MSAFICEDKTINRVVTHLFDHGRDIISDFWLEPYLKEDLSLDCEKLGKEMFNLNVKSVEERYGEGEAKEFRPLDYSFQYESCSKMQVLKSLNCWSYQSCEGTCVDDPLYLLMGKVANGIMQSIINEMPEYDETEWG